MRRNTDQARSARVPGKSSVGMNMDCLRRREYQQQEKAEATSPALQAAESGFVVTCQLAPLWSETLTLELGSGRLRLFTFLIPEPFLLKGNLLHHPAAAWVTIDCNKTARISWCGSFAAL